MALVFYKQKDNLLCNIYSYHDISLSIEDLKARIYELLEDLDLERKKTQVVFTEFYCRSMETNGKLKQIQKIELPEMEVDLELSDQFILNNQMKRLMKYYLFEDLNLTDIVITESYNQSSGQPLMEITDEMQTNIDRLLSIAFIRPGNYILKEDRVILKKPCGQAYGDFIINVDRKVNCLMCGEYKRDCRICKHLI